MADMEVDVDPAAAAAEVSTVDKKGKGPSDKKRFEVKKVSATYTRVILSTTLII